MIVSLCPPHAAVEVARSLAAFAGVVRRRERRIACDGAHAGRRSSAATSTAASIGPPPREAGTTRLYLSGARGGARRGVLRRDDRRRARRSRRIRPRHRRSRWRTPRGRRARRPCCSRRAVARAERSRAGAAGRMEHVAAAARGSVRRGGPVGARQGLAVGRRDGRDRRDVRCGGPAGRLSSCGRRRLPPSAARARGRRRRRRARVVGAACGAAPT